MEETAQELLPQNPILTPELQRALSAAVQTTAGFCSTASHCEQRLGDIEQQIEETSSIDGVRIFGAGHFAAGGRIRGRCYRTDRRLCSRPFARIALLFSCGAP